MTVIEWVAAVYGCIAVWLTIARNKWCWPVGLIQVVLYVFVFWRAKLYSDMLLHAIYIGLQIYGWLQWTSPSAVESETSQRITVRTIGTMSLLVYLTATAVGTVGLGFVMPAYTAAAFPYGDSFTTVASLTAQIFFARRFLANWTFWIAVDLVAIYIYWQKELIPTMILYALILGMTNVGICQRRHIAAERNVSLMDKTPGEQTA